MTTETINKQIIVTAIVFIVTILIFELTKLDIYIQSYFYNFEDKHWLIQKDQTLKYIFYDGFKKLFIIISIIFIVLSLLSFSKRFNLLNRYKKGLIIVALSMLFVPALAIFKNYTNMPCPYNVVTFGGKYPEIKLFETYPKDFVQETKSRCYPAGHATMGFSLMALYFLFKTRRAKNIALLFGVIAGVLTGGYKMLVGHHFLSHTLATMILAWLVILLVVKFVYKIKMLEE
ncbi:phosphatase PAP2 family protein [Aliarcobacter trophiarum]|uniref:phosphatase PAP2 family protein n=1 Tax=Aliarcobacter trophiarum TaxID=708186 RepID=UPI00100A2FFA|nr:phosphatase PAP2 family protein [Aliarcobacter trophiarum]RXI28678.1 phosphoesterase [Aliarcobacter trophiarum]